MCISSFWIWFILFCGVNLLICIILLFFHLIFCFHSNAFLPAEFAKPYFFISLLCMEVYLHGKYLSYLNHNCIFFNHYFYVMLKSRFLIMLLASNGIAVYDYYYNISVKLFFFFAISFACFRNVCLWKMWPSFIFISC